MAAVSAAAAVLTLAGPAAASTPAHRRVPAAVRAAAVSVPRAASALLPTADSFVTRSGSTLLLQGKPFRFVGANEYYLGLDDNVRDAQGRPTYPTHAAIDSALDAAVSLGATVVRAHTLGISVGSPRSVEPSLGRWNDAAFEPVDYAVAAARARGLRLMVPLTDEWRYYHGGKSTFTAWRGYAGSTDPGATAADDAVQRDAEAHFYSDPAVISDFRAYVAHVLGHVNRYTGTAMSSEPTIAVWETGNELWDAPNSWTASTAAYIKSLAPRQLVADGSAANGKHVADAAVDAPAVDIVGGHFYPRDPAWMQQDAAVAAGHGKAYVVGEFDWTGDLSSWLSKIAATPAVSGGILWTLLPRIAGKPEQHGDGYAMWVPGTTAQMTSAQQQIRSTAAALTRSWQQAAAPAPAAVAPQWSTWAGPGGSVQTTTSGLVLRTGATGGWADKASARLVAAASADTRVRATVVPVTTGESYLSLVLRSAGSATSVADEAGYRVELDGGGYASVGRRGAAPALLSPSLHIDGFAAGSPLSIEFAVRGTALELRLWTGPVRPSQPTWSGDDDTAAAVAAPGGAAFSLNGGAAAAPTEWKITSWQVLPA
ncbi:hypothetical protein CLV35_3096 [Motilibacter peucedani]|uniref:mannan endo-1,4-beta-mannosidase n=1 Tax=Motilibacter peucedani TaxID=598650 RepID=A0A420XM40_9ACTN|nr:hypothetical protein CLV35_3096 [Motilibacter peucedani]